MRDRFPHCESHELKENGEEMIADTALDSLIQVHGLKFGLGIVLVVLWYVWYRTSFRTYTIAKQASAESGKGGEVAFPFSSVLLMFALTCVFGYYVSMEHSFREVHEIKSPLVDERNLDFESERVRFVPPAPTGEDPDKQFDEKSKATIEQNQTDNDAAKARFLESSRKAKSPEETDPASNKNVKKDASDGKK